MDYRQKLKLIVLVASIGLCMTAFAYITSLELCYASKDRDSCLLSHSVGSNAKFDSAQCESIKNPDLRDYCFFESSRSNLATQDAKICGKITTTNINTYYNRDYCYLTNAIETKNKTVCSKIENTSMKDTCSKSISI